MSSPESLRTSMRSSPSPTLRQAAETAAQRAGEGMELAEALQVGRQCFPPFLLPVVRCGERSGRLDEALRYRERHCALLDAPSRMMRNTWLAPLAIIIAGSVIKLLAYLALAPLGKSVAYAMGTLADYALLGAAAWLLFGTPRGRRLLDHVKLALPVIAQVERDLAMNRFFHALNLLYSTSGIRVEAMIRLAAQSVDSQPLREDLLRAAGAIETGHSIGQAFTVPGIIPAEYQSMLVSGDEAGKLQQAFETVSRLTGENVEHRLRMFQQVLFRVVMLVVVLSVVFTIYGLMSLRS